MKEELDIQISADGKVRLDVKGHRGKACLDTVEMFKKLLGPVKEQKLTSAYYEGSPGIRNDLEQR